MTTEDARVIAAIAADLALVARDLDDEAEIDIDDCADAAAELFAADLDNMENRAQVIEAAAAGLNSGSPAKRAVELAVEEFGDE